MDEKQNADDARNTTPASESEMTEERFLEAYKKKEYPKPSLTADIAVFRRRKDGLDILLVRRGKHPYQGCWALPGGFAGQKEDVIDAAQRELEEETGVTGVAVELFGIYGTPGRDPRGWTVSGGFCALIDEDVDVRAGDDAADARWCEICETSCSRLSAGEDEDTRENENGTCVLEVLSGDATALSVRFEPISQRFGASRACVVESSGFAFDHAQIVADAYLKVQGR